MDASHRNIAALLGSAGIKFEIGSVAQRKRLQKLVYLAQALGLPRVYDFNWYIHGPYSPRLAKDYYELRSFVEDGENITTLKLAPKYEHVAGNLKRILGSKPAEVPDADWAELLASIVFLLKESHYSPEKTSKLLHDKKGHVADHYPRARKALESVSAL